MFLRVRNVLTNRDYTFNLDDILAETKDPASAVERLQSDIRSVGTDGNIRLAGYVTDSGSEISIGQTLPRPWRLGDIIRLTRWVNDRTTTSWDSGRIINEVYAHLNDLWEWVEHHDYRELSDRVDAVYDIGEEDEFAKDQLFLNDIEIPEELESYFDFTRYGKDLLAQRTTLTWENKIYVLDNSTSL